MDCSNPLIVDNIDILRQGIELIEKIDDHLYANHRLPFLKAGVGSHFRHCIDFYNGFLSSLETGQINYVRRERNPLVETNAALAIAEIESITDRLQHLSAIDLHEPVRVILEESSIPVDAANWSGSTIGRELQSLISHTVHHYAIIALALRLQGYEPAAEFGVAPSTLAYWKQTA